MIALADTPDDHGQDRDLAWLAFRYVAGDLGEAQAAVFERKLDADQSAREAVAEAVALAGAVTLAEGSRRRASRSRRLVLAATAACLLFAGAAITLSRDGPRSVAPSAPAPGPEGSLALAWSGLSQEAGDAPEPPDDPTPAEPSAADAPDEPPAWLVEAAALPAPDAPTGDRGT